MKPLYAWALLGAGMFTGGLIVKFLGFYHSPWKGEKTRQFFKTYCFFQGGAAVTALTAVLLKSNSTISDILAHACEYPRAAFLLSVIALYKFYPRTITFTEGQLNLYWKKIPQCILFWQIPSLYFCMYRYEVLEYTFRCTFIVYTVCFVLGSVIHVANGFVKDFGLIIALCSLIYLLVYLLLSVTLYSDDNTNVSMKVTFITFLSGLLIDDIQHIKLYIEDDSRITFSAYRKSLPLYIEGILLSKCVASLCNMYLAESDSSDNKIS